MSWNRILLLERLGTTSMIIPYCGKTHKIFLLLSKLSTKSRKLLNDYYEGIMNALLEFNLEIEASGSNIAWLFLPWDFFKFSIRLNSKNDWSTFLMFIDNIQQKKGHYFNDRYMHERLCIRSVEFNSEAIDVLYPSIDSFKAIKVWALFNIN